MSDFGAMISIRKKDDSAFTDEEETFVRTTVLEVHEEHRSLANAVGEPYAFDTGITQRLEDTDFYEMNVLLSDYWGNADDFRSYRETETRKMMEVAVSLGTKLSEKYVIDPQYDYW